MKPSRDDNVRAVLGTAALVPELVWERDSVPLALPHVGDEAAAYTPVGEASDSSHARGWDQGQQLMDAVICSPGGALQWRSPAIDTAVAEDKGGNCGC